MRNFTRRVVTAPIPVSLLLRLATYALLCIAQVRDDAKLLAPADRWADRAAALAADPSAFYNDAIRITPHVVGHVSPYHTESGIAVVSALTAHAFGDMYGFERWVNRFLELSSQPCENLDITLGRSGSVLTTSLLLDAWRAVSADPAEGLVDFGNRSFAGIWNELDQFPPIADKRKIGYLGIAHGWAGFGYAALRWRKSAGGQLPPGRAGVTAAPATSSYEHSPTNYWENRATASWPKPQRSTFSPLQIETLCCGLAGASYSMLALYKQTGNAEWLDRARTLANRALHTVSRGEALPYSLYKGQVGVAVLAAELERPEFASLPMFEERRWPSHRQAR